MKALLVVSQRKLKKRPRAFISSHVSPILMCNSLVMLEISGGTRT